MANITIGNVCDAIETTLATATGMNRTQSYDELGEGIPAGDLPLLQVYWEDWNMDPSGNTDRTTFQAGVRLKPFTIHADVYAAQRSHLAEDMKAVVDIVDAVIDVLEAQDLKSYFSQAGIQAWSVSATRGVFPYAGVDYMGARFTFTIWVY